MSASWRVCLKNTYHDAIRNPGDYCYPPGLAPPRSLATTMESRKISFSSPLDVSEVQGGSLVCDYLIHHTIPCGFPIRKSTDHRPFAAPVAYRSLSRPSSAPNAKAFPLRSLLA